MVKYVICVVKLWLLHLAVERYSHVAPHIFRSFVRMSLQSGSGPCVCPGSCVSVSGVLDDVTQHTRDHTTRRFQYQTP